METAVIYVKRPNFGQDNKSLNDSDCYEIAKRLNEKIINGSKGITLQYENDGDKNLENYCAVDVISVTPCITRVFAVLKVKKEKEDN